MSAAPQWFERIAHDLRGPLMPLQTAAYLLRRGQADPDRREELLDLVERQTRRLAGMIDELDDWSHACRDALLSAREPCVPALLLDDALGGGLADALRPDIVDETGDIHVAGDPLRLAQLLRTLLEHASVRRPARIRMRVEGQALRIDVDAAGAAPDAGHLATLLATPMPEPFDEGLGLRLLIARAIAEAHAGSLEAGIAGEGDLRLTCRLPLSA